MTYNLSDYNYYLPENLIAQQLAHPADSAHMMVIDDWVIAHEHFSDIVDHVDSWDLIIFNDSKVVPARVALTAQDSITYRSGKNIAFIIGEAEIFFLRIVGSDSFEALVRRGKWFKTWSIVRIDDYILRIGEVTLAGRMIILSHADSYPQGSSRSFVREQHKSELYEDNNIVLQFLHDHGTIPLPPYIKDDSSKYDDYQPIVATQPWSVAAPTAALHFTDELLTKLSNKGVQQTSVTLHIGIGTFRLIDVDDVRDHEIHREWCQVSVELFTQIAQIHASGCHVIVIGTTSTRIIESLPYLYQHVGSQIILDDHTREYWDKLTQDIIDPGYIVDPLVVWDQLMFDTQLYMYPWFEAKLVDHLVTNFHLPKSTLLLMIASLISYDLLILAYENAIQQEYQFYSFGDGMFIKHIKKNM